MDLMGRVDAYVEIKLGNHTRKTKVDKNTYSPTWDDTFDFTIGPEEERAGLLTLTLMDWDRYDLSCSPAQTIDTTLAGSQHSV